MRCSGGHARDRRRARRRGGWVRFCGRAPRARLSSGRPDRRAPLRGAPGRRCSDQRAGDDQRAGGGSRYRGAPRGQHLHGRRPLRRRRRAPHARGQRRSARWPPMARASWAPRATARSTPACTGCPPSLCATATSTGRARTCMARPAWWRSSAATSSTAPRRRCSATAARRATGSTWPTWCEPTSWRPSPPSPGRSTSATGRRPRCSSSSRRSTTSRPTGRCPRANYSPERPGEVRRSCLDVTRARAELGWEASVSLREGLRTILAGL